MSSSSSGGGQDPTLTAGADAAAANDGLGPFITVVSVDGGIQCGNKLTVITPTEICEMSKQGKQAVIRKLDTSHDKPLPSSASRVTSKLTRPNGDVVKASSANNGDASSPSSTQQQRTTQSQGATSSTDPSQGGAAYVTVVALTEQALHDTGKNKPKSAIPVRAEPASSLSGKKSVVNICNNLTPTTSTAKGSSTAENGVAKMKSAANGDGEGNQVVTIGNKALITKEKEIPYMHHVKNASIVEITMKESNNNGSRRDSSGSENGASWENDIPTKVREPVVVYRLPGERLGFALKFDGGTGSVTEKVKHLVVQSCAEGSPAKRTTTSWGYLGEGDEIIEIENIPVQSMSRMDCVQSLKDSSVAVKLLIEHAYTLDEIQLLIEAKRENNVDENAMKNSERKHPAASHNHSGIPTIHRQTKENKFRETSPTQRELYQNPKSVHSAETGIAEKGVISNNPNQRVTTSSHESEQKKARKLPEITANLSKNDISEIEFDEEAGRNNSRIPIKRGHASSSSAKPNQGHYNTVQSPDYASNNFPSTKDGEKLDELKLQPPVGFEDELHSQQQRFSVGHNNYCEGKNKSENQSLLANDHHYRANEVCNVNEKLNESEDMAALALPENHSLLQPDSMTINNNAVGSTNGNNQNHHNHQHPLLLSSNRSSTTSLNNANPFVHLSGSENLSISTSCCESDETESTRSTVVSRLSIGSSMTSISAVMAVPGCCSNITDSNNNAVTLTQISECSQHAKRKSSPNSSLSMNNNVIVGLDRLSSSELVESLGADEKAKLQHHHHHNLTGSDLHYHQQQLGQQLQHHCRSAGSVNNVTASPYSRNREGLTSSVAEIPLEPPLSFQDRQEQVRRRQEGMIPDINAMANAQMQQLSSATISPAKAFRGREMGANRNTGNDMMATSEREISSENTPKDSATLMHRHEPQYAQLERVRSPSSHHHQQHHHPHQDYITTPGFNTFGPSSRKEPCRNNNNNSLCNESNFNSTTTTTNNNNQIVAVMDGNNNEEDMFDDDELALLADELGLDQEDEDLFKAMLAEIEAADEDLEEYGPILGSSSVMKSERERDLVKPDQQIMKADGDCKQEKSHCERNQRETVVSAKLGTAAFNNNDDIADGGGGGSFSTSNNINRNDNENEFATVRTIIQDGNAAERKRTQSSAAESWTISNSYDNGDVRDLGRITISKDGTRSGGISSPRKMSERVKSGKEIVRVEKPPLMKQELSAGEMSRDRKTNDSCALNVTGSSDNKGLIDEGCNGNFESSSPSTSSSDLQQQRLMHHLQQKSHQHTQQAQHLQHQHPHRPQPARPLSYHKEACKQGNEYKNGTIILQNEKVVEPIMDKRFVERNQIVLLTSQQETSVTSITGDTVLLNPRDMHRNTNPFNNLDDKQDDLTNTTAATNQKIMSSPCSTRDHTHDEQSRDEDNDNNTAGGNTCSNGNMAGKNVSRIKRMMLPQESSSKMTLFVAGLPAPIKEHCDKPETLGERGLRTDEQEGLPNNRMEGLPPSPPRRAKGPEKRSLQEDKYETSHNKFQGEILRSNQEVSKTSTEAGGAGEVAVEKIKGDEKLVASDVHSTARHNSLKVGLSVVNCGGGDGAKSLANAKGSISNVEVINNKEATTAHTDSGGIVECEDGKINNSRRIHVTSSSSGVRGSSSSTAYSTCPTAVSSVTSSVVKNSSESTALSEPTRKNVDCNQQTGDDRICSNSNCTGPSCPQRNECSPSSGATGPAQQESTVSGVVAGCRSTSEVVVVEVVAGKRETYFKGSSQPTTLLSSSQSSSSLAGTSTSSSSLSASQQESETSSGTARQAGSSGPDIFSTSPGTMDSSTEVLHQYIPPTFSRLPPDGDEFPNSWDEKQSPTLKKFDSRQLYRAELNLTKVDLDGAPPPLPTTGPPVEDFSPVTEELTSTKSHPVSMPHLPPKPIAARQCSIDDKRKVFESSPVPINNSNKSPLQFRTSSSGASSMNSTNGTNSNTNSPPTMSRSTGLAAEPSKKSVRDKIALFSSRTPSTEDTPDFTAKPPTGAIITSSLKKSALVGNGTSLSRSSDNILQGLNMSTSSISGNENDSYRGISSLPKINRSSLDISSISNGGAGINSNGSSRKSSVDVLNFNSRPLPFYGSSGGEIRSSTLGRGATTKYQYENTTSNGNADAFTSGKVLYERSQSMIDVGGPGAAPIPNNNAFRNSYHTESTIAINRNGAIAPARYSTSTINTTISPTMNGRLPPSSANGNSGNAAASSIMEQRRKCMTKLRGLVIPDVPPSDVVAQVSTSNGLASIVDLPTIISKDAAVIIPQVLGTTNKTSSSKAFVSRSESLDGISSSDDNSSLQFSSVSTVLSSPSHTITNSAKLRSGQFDSTSSDLPDWKLTTNALPKYSPAFKRRSLTAYQSSTLSSSNKSSLLTSPQPYRAASQLQSKPSAPVANTSNITPEPKSLESLTSPKSDSSFEFSRQKDSANSSSQPTPVKRNSFEKAAPQNGMTKDEVNVQDKVTPSNNTVNGKGKLDDSDNDSAVSSSRSSISHGLSPPNSPTPGESSTTPDPDQGESSRDEERAKLEAGMDESSMSDESWRILKAQSVEAINRKNVLTSAKFSSGGAGALGNPGDDSSISSSNGKNRRSDDEEASYADAETEDTESSCSELEVSKSRRRMIVAGRVNLSQRRNCKADTEEEDYEELDEQTPAHLQPVTLHSEQHSLDLGDDLVLPGLTESPLQAIYDMEVKMAYINEVCDALPGRTESGSRYFSRRDSEATVIERPIEPKRKLSMDMLDSADRRARNRSSSGNESDFSSSISQKSTLSRSSRDRETKPEADRWSLLEKKYSKSMTAVNLVAGKSSEPVVLSATLQPAASVPKIVTGASEIVEKKIEKIIEKSAFSADGSLKKVTNANIPRGRNDFKSLAEKWQLISNDSKSTGPPPVGPKPSLSRQNSTSSISSTATAIAVAPPTITSASMKNNRFESENSDSSTPSSPSRDREMITKEPPTPSSRTRPSISPKPTATSTPMKSSTVSNVLEAIEADTAWAETRRSDMPKTSPRLVKSPNPEHVQMAPTKRSVSVNDIRKAFEKAETAIGYGREDHNSSAKKDPAALTLPSVSAAHFRVSSFDSTTSEESSATTPAGIYGSVNSLVSSAPRDPYGSITSLASSTSLISPQELQQLIDEANQSLEEAGTPSHEVSVVILHREFVGGSLGITLAGGADYETKEITVHKVITGSIADRDARVHRGDRVLSINGKSTRGLTHREALNLLKAPRTEVVLVVSRGRTSANGFKTIDEASITLDRAVEPLLTGSLSSLLENDDDIIYKWGLSRTVSLNKDGAGLGFSLEGGKGSISGDRPLTVKKIFIGGPAEKCGEMRVGDLIVSINGVSMSTKSRTEAWNFMKKLGDGEVKIAVRSPLV